MGEQIIGCQELRVGGRLYFRSRIKEFLCDDGMVLYVDCGGSYVNL